MIPFNKPYIIGNELSYITDAVQCGKISGNGKYTKLCQEFFENAYGFKKCLLTTSCTDALEMAAILLNIVPGDEIIMPAFTFVSTANAFILRGAKIVFVDSKDSNPNIDETKIEALITEKTKAIVVVHYAGIPCNMDYIMNIANTNNLYVIEDAAQAIDSFYNGKALGGIGHMGTYSFHETKNIQCGEGGMLMINDEKFKERAEIIWEKGTNRAAFFRGEIDKYGWVDIGSSFLPSELNAAFLFAQLENLEKIQSKRKQIWNAYYVGLQLLEENGHLQFFNLEEHVSNGHMFYMVCKNLEERKQLIQHLKQHNVHAVFHYQSLHLSNYFADEHDGRTLGNVEKYSNQLVRLPLYYDLTIEEVEKIIKDINAFYEV
ncbi:dTDP-4-amino-4,6-dideoxygalactose transaminase [Kordia sp. YSTF-M3]|uniref:dTDP-4-amino-4,6-dideoxygalactose transaminase n=1 Tax=Kordia aestuariivivens TaxID=2759037 RepID=A0ABR7Q996_9FLAO|nr:dTDP-4-amino-4,6-dideoxygalactose transaminase [Kordia aestuariivivens]MBC8755139.1 dTDP-4-amino-4,6-dideoxygalactose transaminase [Kordia aestuariivivens]